MPPLENWKHEKFCQLIVSDVDKTNAYRKVYDPKDINPQKDFSALGSHLLNRQPIKQRIQEIRNRAIERAELKRADIIKFLRRYIEIDFNAELIRPSDALKAAELLAKMCGFNEPEKLLIGPSDELTNVLRKLRDGTNGNALTEPKETKQLTID